MLYITSPWPFFMFNSTSHGIFILWMKDCSSWPLSPIFPTPTSSCLPSGYHYFVLCIKEFYFVFFICFIFKPAKVINLPSAGFHDWDTNTGLEPLNPQGRPQSLWCPPAFLGPTPGCGPDLKITSPLLPDSLWFFLYNLGCRRAVLPVFMSFSERVALYTVWHVHGGRWAQSIPIPPSWSHLHPNKTSTIFCLFHLNFTLLAAVPLLQFFFSSISLVKFVPRYFILSDAIVNGIMLIFLLASSLLVYKNETHLYWFCILQHYWICLLILTVLGWNLWGFLYKESCYLQTVSFTSFFMIWIAFFPIWILLSP